MNQSPSHRVESAPTDMELFANLFRFEQVQTKYTPRVYYKMELKGLSSFNTPDIRKLPELNLDDEPKKEATNCGIMSMEGDLMPSLPSISNDVDN
ncbi:uncharacterized protein DMAD_12794 [Drosophila madeirensis]|uniref:Uncharacterized protein n=1 Tax=Drosophila madeirensis TaxID=30013 RepID=A0AAU9FHN0_DROMD